MVLTKAALSGNVNAAVRWLIMRGGWTHPKGPLGEVADDNADPVRFYIPVNGRDRPEGIIDPATLVAPSPEQLPSPPTQSNSALPTAAPAPYSSWHTLAARKA